MKLYQKRMLTEKKELDGKISRLEHFILEPPDGVPLTELSRMKDQLKHMQGYSQILAERIHTFI